MSETDNVPRGTNTKKVLGRGLSALISKSAQPNAPIAYQQGIESMEEETRDEENKISVKLIQLTDIIQNPLQPRKVFNQEELEELSESIKSHGILQPLLVRPYKGKFEIIAGERRWRAAQLAKITQLPVIIRETSNSDAQKIALVENIQRSELSAIEEARGYERLIEEFGLTHDEVAEAVGKSRATITNFLRLLKLPRAVIEMISEGKITTGHAKAILTVKEPQIQMSLAQKVIAEGLSVRALESIVGREVSIEPPKHKEKATFKKAISPYNDTVEKLRNTLGTRVSITRTTTGRGKIDIEYFSEEELDRIVDLICDAR